MRNKMQTETRKESTNSKDILILIPSAVQHTKEEITEKSERVSNLTQKAPQKKERKTQKKNRSIKGQKQRENRILK